MSQEVVRGVANQRPPLRRARSLRRVTNERGLLCDAIASLVETSGQLIWSLDLEGRWTYLNATVEPLYGRKPRELIGRPFVELVARELQERDEAVFQRVCGGEPVFDHETRHLRADGSYVDLSFDAIARRDPQGASSGRSAPRATSPSAGAPPPRCTRASRSCASHSRSQT